MRTETPNAADLSEWALLEGYLPGLPPQTIGILLRDVRDDSLHVRLRPHCWHGLLEEEEVWSELEGDLNQRAQEIGAAQVLDWLENTASHAIQISARQEIRLTQVEAAMDALYQEYLGALDPRLEPIDHRLEQTLVGLPESEAPGRARNSKRYPQFDNAWAQAAVAATLVLGATLAGIWYTRLHPSKVKQQSKTYEAIALPVFAGPRCQPVLFHLDSGCDPHCSTSHYTKKMHRISSNIRLHRLIQAVFVQPQLIETAYLEPPNLEFAPEVSGASFLPVSTSDAPEFQPRRNAFVRVLAVIVYPFRLMFSSRHTPQNRLPSSPTS